MVYDSVIEFIVPTGQIHFEVQKNLFGRYNELKNQFITILRQIRVLYSTEAPTAYTSMNMFMV